jgi:hypothetical protein
MSKIKKQILVSTGNLYEVDVGEYKVLNEEGQIVKIFKTGMWVTEKKVFSSSGKEIAFSEFSGKKMRIAGFDIEKEILFVRTPGMEIAEFYERWLPVDASHKGKEEMDCFLNLERTDAPFLVQIGESIGEKVGRATRALNGLRPSEI